MGGVRTVEEKRCRCDTFFDRVFLATMLPNEIGYIPTGKACLLLSEKALTNRLKPGCAEPAVANAFEEMDRSYLPVWQAAMKQASTRETPGAPQQISAGPDLESWNSS